MNLPNDCLVLDGVVCHGLLSRERLFCPRSIRSIGAKSGSSARTSPLEPALGQRGDAVLQYRLSISRSASRASWRRPSATSSTCCWTTAAPTRGGRIAREFAAKDSRIRFVAPDVHLPMWDNLNRVLRHISPESRHTKMVLADDWLYPECLERMVAVAESDPAVGGGGLLPARWLESRLAGYAVSRDRGPGKHAVPALPDAGPERLRQSDGGDVPQRPGPAREHFFLRDSLLADTEACIDLLRESAFGFVHSVIAYARGPRGFRSATP